MNKNKLLILPIIFLLTSCGSNVDNSKRDDLLDDYYSIKPIKDYYQEYESATVSYYEPTEDVHIFNKKEITLNSELFNEWKNYVFEYVNYGDRQNLVEYGDGASIKCYYFVHFDFSNNYDVYRFKKDTTYMTGLINGEHYYNNNDPQISDELIKKKSDLINKIDKELEKVESKQIEHYC